MSLSSSLSKASKAAQAKEAKKAVTLLFKDEVTPDYTEMDEVNGTYSVDGVNFSYSGGKLVMLVFCDKCKAEVPSKPIRKLADIQDNLDNPQPGRHTCGDA